MSALIIIMPIVPRRNFADPAWREQYERECHALHEVPPRTRPIEVILDRPSRASLTLKAIGRCMASDGEITRDNFQFHMRALCDHLSGDATREGR